MTDYRQSSKQDINEIKQDSSIGPNDVLLGRGGATNNHDGNRRFRLLVADHQQEYLQARKRDKVDIARRIVSIVQSKGGRFLKRGSDDATWVPVSDKRAQEKTSQALREGLDVRNNTIRPSKMIKAVRRNSESSSSQSTSQQFDKSKPFITGKVVTPKSPSSALALMGGHPFQSAVNRHLYMPDLKVEPTEPVFLLYQPPPLSQQDLEHTCEV